MQRHMTTVLALALLGGTPASAGLIEQACLNSDRAEGTGALCTCIQEAADRTLNERDQRLAATFFEEPDRAQTIRQSSRRSHEIFWERYVSFGEIAEVYCSS